MDERSLRDPEPDAIAVRFQFQTESERVAADLVIVRLVGIAHKRRRTYYGGPHSKHADDPNSAYVGRSTLYFDRAEVEEIWPDFDELKRTLVSSACVRPVLTRMLQDGEDEEDHEETISQHRWAPLRSH